ncbi:glycosyltransferase family 4 protein [Methylobacterium sp. WL119]|uniref:glycosyltransferase n=2 Tax=Methylobacterium TaxID=407 RepID=UPI0011C8806E|nr:MULTISPECIES: glycosyltransferase [unclassified Methylobacterium]TXN36640.1 glycosyltransferase family 4 protein [Methylobacterium sp. WL93]TXN45966.1 glycosyltransferase family 4 protein [Methylobacterium sp. WL119]
MKVAIIHYWLVGMRGGEKVVEALCEMYPDADVFTHVYVPDSISAKIRSHRITTSFISKLPKSSKMYQSYLPLMPLALEQLDLRGYDLIISSESGPAKGIIPPPESLHICYCHSPMRYIWNMFHDYRERSGFLTRLMMPVLAHYVRNWDAISANRVDYYVANSKTVASRLQRYYRRESTVIHPPVTVRDFSPVASEEVSDYYLMVGELVAYKRPELAVELFNRTGKKLVVIGGGQMLHQLRAMAQPNVTLLGSQPFDVLKHHYARCRALIFPGEEDFGIVPVEAMASGRPVIAFKRGGATETVVEGRTGVFFDVQSCDAIQNAIVRFEGMTFNTTDIVAHANDFSETVFEKEMRAFIRRALDERAGHSQDLSHSIHQSKNLSSH